MNATKQQQRLCFLLAYRRVDNCLQTVSRAILVLSAVLEHLSIVLLASGLGTLPEVFELPGFVEVEGCGTYRNALKCNMLESILHWITACLSDLCGILKDFLRLVSKYEVA